MRFVRAAFGAVFAFGVVSAAVAQAPVSTAGYNMPGTAVGKPSVQPVGAPVGSRLPDVGTRLPPAVGQGAGQSPFGGAWPTPDPKTVDPKSVVAPYPMQPAPASDFWDKLQQRWATLFDPPKPPQTNNWVPGLSRRARERRERAEAALERWQRD
jgi:hypothetical protein